MTTMKESTTCGRREMRALYESRQVNVADPETRVRIVKGIAVSPRRLRRDDGNAPWGAHLTATGKTLPRKIRRALSGVRKVSDMETLVAMENLLCVKGTR
jgi:hypothetical protein